MRFWFLGFRVFRARFQIFNKGFQSPIFVKFVSKTSKLHQNFVFEAPKSQFFFTKSLIFTRFTLMTWNSADEGWRKISWFFATEGSKKSRNFSGEPRDARKIWWNTTSNRQIFDRNRYEIARGDYGKFSNFGSEIEFSIRNPQIDVEIINRMSKIRSPYSSRISFRDIKIRILRPRFGQNLAPWIFLRPKSWFCPR